ncbi:MAG: hypothetical protein U0326_05285 [Polyangiales bacterium]
MPSPNARSRAALGLFLALSCGCSLTLDCNRDDTVIPLDGAAGDTADATSSDDVTTTLDTPPIDYPAMPDVVVRPDVPVTPAMIR